MRIFLSTLFLSLLGWSVVFSQPRVSLLTCGPGDAIYSLFGHSAIRVQDPERRIDQVYNYGTFDFNTPNFTLKFMQGRLLYQLDVQTFKGFMREYRYDQREVYEEELLLDAPDRDAVIAFLADNYRPDKRYYRYDFFFDNCSSRIRDVLEAVLQDRLSYQFPPIEEPVSFREAIDPYIGSRPWLDLGIDLLLGRPSDRMADERGLMFLPNQLSDQLAFARIDGERPLLGPRQRLIEPDSGRQGDSLPYPTMLFWALLPGLLLAWRFRPSGKWVRSFDTAFWLLFGLAGCLVAFMWWGTDHGATQQNWNILWLNPLQLLIGLALLRNKKAGWPRLASWAQLVIVALLLVSWPWLPQSPPLAALPLVLLLGLQSARLAGLMAPKKGTT